MIEDPLSGVTVFVTCARASSFTEAAQRLGITKSAVGKAIARLETRLGITLFNRSTRVVRLTADGESYLAACVSALEEVTAAQDALASSGTILSGRVRIDMPVAVGRKVLLPILLDIVQPHPGLRLALSFTDSLSDLLEDKVDLAIRFGALADSSVLIARRLADQKRVICAAPEYLDRAGRPHDLSDLDLHECIVGSLQGPPTAWLVSNGDQVVKHAPSHFHNVSDGEAMVDMARAGFGLIQVPEAMVRDDIAAGKLEEVLHGFTGPSIPVHAVWPRQAHLSPRVRHIVDRLVIEAAKGRLG
ncbi:LysR family transcriptional regulator [Novosphingobium profundi]|uniref:LysR family transcriptional regulator n=1 Tax=Novosphingobium profundi TaxID=1774954 RepID=UPI001BDB2F51|nr:LysR family transcriptional regulator [Novosphingobium profundi]MBT0667300.1 LysR family transcriptional regulator [Novosphingobium profundi]